MSIVIIPRLPTQFFPDASELEFSYARSSGPGGQNVNKVNSKAVLRWSVRESRSLSGPLREHLLQRLASQLNSESELVIASDVYRDQGRNREDCVERLRAILAQALHVPKKRKATRPSYSSQQKQKSQKQQQSAKKRARSGRSGRFDD